jgi:hypothetical protein
VKKTKQEKQDLRALVRAELGVDDRRIQQIIKIGRRAGLEEEDALATAWLAGRDPMHYAGHRGPRPHDPLLRALQVEGERQSARRADWDASTPESLTAAELLADAIASAVGRERRRGTRPQVQRRAAAARQHALEAGQAGFNGLGWGMPA